MMELRKVIADYKKSLKDMNDFVLERHNANSQNSQVTMKEFYMD